MSKARIMYLGGRVGIFTYFWLPFLRSSFVFLVRKVHIMRLDDGVAFLHDVFSLPFLLSSFASLVRM